MILSASTVKRTDDSFNV